MGRSSGKDKGKKKKNGVSERSNNGNGLLWVDPNRVRFQHSKIRPLFSGCGRSIYETLESIRKHEISPSELPPIQVIVGPETEEGRWYFSLNNRRLWVLKRCREEGLLQNNEIQVRVRAPKSSAEEARYSLQNCALEAKVVSEPQKRANPKGSKKEEQANDEREEKEPIEAACENEIDDKQVSPTDSGSSDEDDEDFDSDDEVLVNKHPFSALM